MTSKFIAALLVIGAILMAFALASTEDHFALFFSGLGAFAVGFLMLAFGQPKRK